MVIIMRANGDLGKWTGMESLLKRIHTVILEILNLIKSMDMVKIEILLILNFEFFFFFFFIRRNSME